MQVPEKNQGGGSEPREIAAQRLEAWNRHAAGRKKNNRRVTTKHLEGQGVWRRTSRAEPESYSFCSVPEKERQDYNSAATSRHRVALVFCVSVCLCVLAPPPTRLG